MYHLFAYNRELFMEHYHKGSNAESAFAMIKGKFFSPPPPLFVVPNLRVQSLRLIFSGRRVSSSPLFSLPPLSFDFWCRIASCTNIPIFGLFLVQGRATP